MPETKRPLKVFLYHAPSDKDVVRELYLRLIKNGVDAWFVKERLLPGQDWKHEMEWAAREADVVIVCLSERFIHGEARQKEARTAFDAVVEQLKDEIFMISVCLEECERSENLKKWQSVDLFTEAGYEMLMYTLQARADQVGADIRIKEHSLPEIAGPAAKHTEPAPEEQPMVALQERPDLLVAGPGILLEGPVVSLQGKKLRSPVSRRRLGRAMIAVWLALAGLLVVAVHSSPQFERWSELSFKSLVEPVSASSAGKISEPIVKTAHANIVFLIDTSNSMEGPRLKNASSAVSDFISDLDDRYLVSLMQFNTSVELQMRLTANHADASDAIKSMTIASEREGSCFYDALYAGILETSLVPQADGTSNIIVLLTDISPSDLMSNCSASSMDNVRDLKAKNPVSIFIVQVGDQYGYWGVDHTTADIGAPVYSAGTRNKINKAFASISKEMNLQLKTKEIKSAAIPAETISAWNAPMVFVPPGEFLMGDHPVSLDAFWIDKTEVTNAMYAECVQSGQCNAPHSVRSSTHDNYYGNYVFDNYPVIFVSWTDASAYCTWTGERLPTEAEWEKAARGTDGRPFPWGSAEPWPGLLNYQAQDTTEVGTYPNGASPYGALDMAGNVAEWVADWFSLDDYNHPPESNPLGPEAGEYRVWRGGSWANTSADWIHTYSRTGNPPTDYSSGLGFRCARDASP